jgi:hypothetical protein
MSRLAALLLLPLAASCGPRVELNVRGDAGCAEAACPVPDDAGALDASHLPIDDPRFPNPGSPEDFRALAAALDGLYHGVSVRDQRATRFEIEFEAGESAGRGRFDVRCLDQPGCNPFGPGSMPLPGEGHYELVSIDTHDRGQGELSWGRRALPEVEFWRMTRDERVLSFLVGYLGLSPAAGVYASIVLAPGGWPDGGDPFTQEVDAGAADAGAEAGAP